MKHIEGLDSTYAVCGRMTPVTIDVTVVTETEVRALGQGCFENRRFLYGSDVLAAPRERATREVDTARCMSVAVSVLTGLYRTRGPVVPPLSPPDPADPWLGFGPRLLRRADGPRRLGRFAGHRLRGHVPVTRLAQGPGRVDHGHTRHVERPDHLPTELQRVVPRLAGLLGNLEDGKHVRPVFERRRSRGEPGPGLRQRGGGGRALRSSRTRWAS